MVEMAALLRWKRQRTSEAADEFDFGFSDSNGGDDVGAIGLFDCSMRTEVLTIEKEVWALKARGIAVDIKRGALHHISWWSPLVSSPAVPLPGARLSGVTGLHSFQVDGVCCQHMVDFLEDGSNYDKDGFLKMADTQWPGYSSYPYVHATHHIQIVQERKTVRVAGKKQVNWVLRREPRVWALVQAVRMALGLPQPLGGALQPPGKIIRAMHFLQQDETQQASFSWHSDGEDITDQGCLRTDEMTTVIVQLSDGEVSAMRIWGFAPHVYEGQGSAVAFPGAALHESLPRSEPSHTRVWKVAFFFC